MNRPTFEILMLGIVVIAAGCLEAQTEPKAEEPRRIARAPSLELPMHVVWHNDTYQDYTTASDRSVWGAPTDAPTSGKRPRAWNLIQDLPTMIPVRNFTVEMTCRINATFGDQLPNVDIKIAATPASPTRTLTEIVNCKAQHQGRNPYTDLGTPGLLRFTPLLEASTGASGTWSLKVTVNDPTRFAN